jgi:hypothetical protein
VEERLLDTVTRQAGVNVPAPSAELLLYLLRIMLKHTRLAEAAKVNEKYAPIRDELLWLLKRSDVAEAQEICRLWFPTVSVPLANMVAAALDPGQVLRRSVLGLRIARDLRHLTRTSIIADTVRPPLGLDRLPGIHGLVVENHRARVDVDPAHLDEAVRALGELGLRSLTSQPPTRSTTKPASACPMPLITKNVVVSNPTSV